MSLYGTTLDADEGIPFDDPRLRSPPWMPHVPVVRLLPLPTMRHRRASRKIRGRIERNRLAALWRKLGTVTAVAAAVGRSRRYVRTHLEDEGVRPIRRQGER